jgi:hypothetical protein
MQRELSLQKALMYVTQQGKNSHYALINDSRHIFHNAFGRKNIHGIYQVLVFSKRAILLGCGSV